VIIQRKLFDAFVDSVPFANEPM